MVILLSWAEAYVWCGAVPAVAGAPWSKQAGRGLLGTICRGVRAGEVAAVESGAGGRLKRGSGIPRAPGGRVGLCVVSVRCARVGHARAQARHPARMKACRIVCAAERASASAGFCTWWREDSGRGREWGGDPSPGRRACEYDGGVSRGAGMVRVCMLTC